MDRMFNVLLCCYLNVYVMLVFWGVTILVTCWACACSEDLLQKIQVV